MGDLVEAGGGSERRLDCAGAHGVTRGANIKRELTPLLNIANLLCLGCGNHAKDAEDSRDDQRSDGQSNDSILLHQYQLVVYKNLKTSRQTSSRRDPDQALSTVADFEKPVLAIRDGVGFSGNAELKHGGEVSDRRSETENSLGEAKNELEAAVRRARD